MDKHRFRVGGQFIIAVNAKTVSAAWFRLGQKYGGLLCDYGYVYYLGVKEKKHG